ncbi:MAG: guanylate kinase [Proteobacteria bacterium]|nr:guanylate kinase [Pseudomonadota bacterium]
MEKFGLIVVSAPSGAGKSTLCARLLQDLGERLALSISTTSRAPRGQEVHGREYFFATPEEFKSRIDRDDFAEWALVHGNYYGTSRSTLRTFWESKRHVLLDIDVQGAATLRKSYGKSSYLVFIAPPSLEVLEQRLRSRGTESEEAVQKRMKNAVSEMAQKDSFDLILVNDDFETAYAALKTAVTGFMDQLEEGKWPSRTS